jgi:hypothetical protein
MRLTATSRYPAGPDAVARLLADPSLVAETLIEPGPGADGAATPPLKAHVDVTGEADGAFTVAIRRTMPAAGLPDHVRALLPGGLDMRQTIAWDVPAADRSRRGTVAIEIMGAPVRLTGTVVLAPVHSSCEERYDVELRAMIPFVGAKLEQAAAPLVQRTLEAERDAILARLAAAE